MLGHIIARRAGWGLRVQVFASGAVIMALELIGSRLLAPVYGNSIFVWGSLIGVVLTGLAIGYFSGGRLADRGPTLRTFSSIVFSGGLYTVVIPFISPIIIDFTLRVGLGDRYGPLLGTSIILGPPAVILGMLSPYAVRLAANTLTSLGNVAGNLYSLSTIGSIFGTFFTVFVLIPSFEVRSIVFGLGLSLMAVSLLGLTRGPFLLFLFIAVLLLSPLSSFAVGLYSHAGNLVFEKETPYSHLDVVDLGDTRALYLNGMRHSAMYLNGSSNLAFTYTRYFHLGFLFSPSIKDVLFVGGGGFSGPKNFLDTYQEIRVDVVEIDPDVIEVAKDFFNVREDPRLTIINDDARRYLSGSDRTYDLIVLDAYTKTYVPFHLMTEEFYSLLHSRLTPDGVVVSTLIASVVGDTSDIFWAEYKTASQVFPSLYVFPTSDFSLGFVQNVILVATKNPTVFSESELERMVLNDDFVASLDFGDYVSHYFEGRILIEGVPLLTDEFAPVESLLNPSTGRPYVLEIEAGGRNTPGLAWSENASAVFAMLVFAIFAWLVYLSRRSETSQLS